MVLLVIIVPFLGGCSLEQSSNSNSTPITGEAASSYGEEALQNSQKLMILVVDETNQTLPGNFASLGTQCWNFLKEASSTDANYTLQIISDSANTEQPFRDVQDVRVRIDFPKGQQAVIWWYAGAVNSCLYRMNPQEEWQ